MLLVDVIEVAVAVAASAAITIILAAKALQSIGEPGLLHYADRPMALRLSESMRGCLLSSQSIS